MLASRIEPAPSVTSVSLVVVTVIVAAAAGATAPARIVETTMRLRAQRWTNAGIAFPPARDSIRNSTVQRDHDFVSRLSMLDLAHDHLIEDARARGGSDG